MAKRKQRFLQGLCNATQSLSQPKITPILSENCQMRVPADDSDCYFHTNAVSSQVNKEYSSQVNKEYSSQVNKEYSSYFKNLKSDWRAESATCNVCSAPCSSCLHINQREMGLKADACSGEASAENALKFSVNDAVPNDKIINCETVQKSETRNIVSGVSSYTYENIDCETSIRNYDLSATSETISVFPKIEDSKGQEDHDNCRSCVSGAEDTKLSNSLVRNGDSTNFPSHPVSADSLIAQKNLKAVDFRLSSQCLDVRCDFNESQNDSSSEQLLKKLPLSLCSQADISSQNSSLLEISSETAGDVTHLLNVQSNLSHPVIDKSPSHDHGLEDLEDKLCSHLHECFNGHSTSLSMKVESGFIPSDLAVDTVEKNESIDKDMGSRCLPDTDENPFECHAMVETDDSDIVEHDVKVCDICGDAGREDLLAICCRCSDGAEHTYCMREMVDKVPVGDWLCEECKFDVEMKNQRQEKACSADASEKINSSGQANPDNSNFSTKSEAKGSDVGGNRNDPPNMKNLGKRCLDDTEVSRAAKKRVVESDFCSAKISTSSGIAAISRDSSFKRLDRGKAKPIQHPSSGTLSAHDTATSPASGSQLQGTFIKSNSFNSLNVKPKIKLVNDVAPQKQRLVREPASLDKKEGDARPMSKSVSFKLTNAGRLNFGEPKVKMLSPKCSNIQETIGSKHTKDRNLFERRNSFKSERMSVSPSIANSGTLTAKNDQKLVSSGEPNSLFLARNFHDTKVTQSDSRSLLSKSPSFVGRSASELPASLGEFKRQSSTKIFGVSSSNGSGGPDLKPNQGSPKEDSSSSSHVAEMPTCNINDGLPDGLSRAFRPKESTNLGERGKDNISSCSKQRSMISGRIVSCRKCKETGHSARCCTQDHLESPAVDATAAKNPREMVDGKDKLKAAIEAAVLRKPGIYRKNRISDQLDDILVSNINCEVATPDQLLDSSNRGIVSSSGEMQEGQILLGNSTADSCEQATVDDDVKQFPVLSVEASISRKGDVCPVVPLGGLSLVKDVPGGVSAATSTFLKTLAIPDHEYIWQGVFEVIRIGKSLNLFDGIQAHLSTCASPKVLEVVNKFAHKVLLNEVPRLTTWPVQFQEYGVKEDNVALFFFAKDIASYEKSYKVLLDNMMKNDLALKGNFDGFELMIFPSNQLPEKSQRWNALFFLWGVFRGKRADCSHVLACDKQTFITQSDPTAIMPFPQNLCSLWPINKGLSAGSSKLLASQVAALDLLCLQSSSEGCDDRVSSEVMNNDTVLSVKPQDNKLDLISSSGVENSIAKSCGETVQTSILCDEMRHTSTSLEGGVDSDHKIEVELHASADSTSRVRGISIIPQMSMDQNSHLNRQHSSRYFRDSPAHPGGTGSVGNVGEGDVLDKMSSSRCQVSLEDVSLDKAAACATGNQTMKDKYRNHLDVDSLQRMPKAVSAGTNNVKSGIAADDISVEEARTSKKQKTDICRLYGANDQTSSIIEGSVSDIHGVASGSPIQANGHGEAYVGSDVREIKGNAERYFFPVDPGSGKDVGLVGKFIPWKMSPLEEDQLQDRAPNLELALGAETKALTQGTIPFLVGKGDKMNVQDHCSHVAAAKGDEDEVSASLSLSLSFPFPDKEQTVKSLSKAEQLMPERRHVNSSLLLFGGLRDK